MPLASLLLCCALLVHYPPALLAAPAQPQISNDQGTRLDDRTPFFEHQSDIDVGDKGEITLQVGSNPEYCQTPAWVFDHAELVVTDSRFADAQMVQIPESGCFECSPLVVRWFHEPTGRVAFHVNVYRRLAPVECPQRGKPS